MKKKPYIFTLIFFVLTCQIGAQNFNKILLDNLSVGTGFGVTQFFGDAIEGEDLIDG